MRKNSLKITLINPPLPAEEQAGSFAGVVNVMQPLGIAYIAAVLEKNNFNVDIIDCIPLRLSDERLLSILKKEPPDIIGITATVLSINRAMELSKRLKKELPGALLVIGGPHITSIPNETMNSSSYDVGVLGEGELTFLEIAQQLSGGRLNLKSIKSIVYRKGKELVFTAPREFIKDLDSLPFPARHLLPPLKDYMPVPASYIKLPLGHLMTSRGCPYQCIFCDRKVFGNMVRTRSPKNVVDEIEELMNKHGAKEIKFFDDTFTMDYERVLAIFKEMEKRRIKIPWSCLTRVNRVSKELLIEMKNAGCWQVAYGLESGNQKILNRMKKGITLEQSRNAVMWAKEAGLNVRAFFVLGTPGETLGTIRDTIEFAKSLPLDVVTFYTITLYPGNELFEIAKKEGTVLHKDYSQYSPLIDFDETELAYVPEGMTQEQFKSAISSAHREFYLRPGFILRQVLSIRRPEDVVRYARAFFTIIRM